MPSYIVSGKAYRSDNITVVASVIIHIKNKTLGESHSGNDNGFTDLVTDSNGNWSVDLEDFTAGFNNADKIEISANNTTHGKDIVTTTVDSSLSGESDIRVVLQSDEKFQLDSAIDTLGETVDRRKTTSTYVEEEYGQIDTESSSDDTVTAHVTIDFDDETIMPEGELKAGEATAVFKTRDDLLKGQLIRIPRTSGDWWKIMNKPIRRRALGTSMYDFARIRRQGGE